ncbi:endonuclease/exonuclease/phosphatase family protein [Sulfitobacter sp. F26169L]|uniref:endonuclease/exonuclease/phosphatase family protein n=1 Tax=Sulfitobacter sp. F26169L TaxID=2996015 RepID=UPI002260C98B|nr:endonuclease/exonuclease/phosphatase family protein [Sulfitobacter sp. F26169L]MCX7566529.1 endonuclease/exonuclease/phosphatase family protein [Sulfitobacter sp. F26169L]
MAFAATAADAQDTTVRIATFNAELKRKGPGLLLRDILKGKDPQIAAFKTVLLDVRPDIIALQGIDYDLRATALNALADDLAKSGISYPHRFTAAPNAGQTSGMDLNGNGRLGDADDAHGYGRFNGAGGMAVLSRFPIQQDAVEDYTAMLWRDLPDNIYPMKDGAPFGGDDIYQVHRLSTRGHWIVPVVTPDFGTLRLMTFHATPPVYDGPEDRNGRRNHDEAAFWLHYMVDDKSGLPFVLSGTSNTDPARGNGRPAAMIALLDHPKLQNPFDDTPTADFKEPVPGDLRVDYLLPSTGWRVVDHGMVTAPAASRHSLLWVDIAPRNP